MKRFFILLSLLVLTAAVKAQPRTTKGKEFWFTYMENLSLSFNGPPGFSLIISSETATTGAIEVPHTGLSIPFSVPAMQDIEVTLPQGILYPQGDENIITFGFRVVANDSVSVYTYHHRVYFSEASLVVPVTELTSSYMLTGQKDDRGIAPCEFVVEATQDSTAIEITPSQITASFRPSGVPFYVTLDKGNVFQLQSYQNLSGTTVRSLDPGKKLAIFSGARQSSLRCSAADDHLYDQNYMSMFGEEFVLTPMFNQGGDVFNMVSLEDSNQVYLNFGQAIQLSKGQFIDTLLNNATYVVSSKPIAVSQYNKSQTCNLSNLGDPNMVIIPPVNLRKTTALFRNIDYDLNGSGAFSAFYVNIVVPTSGTGSVFLDGQPVTGFQTVPSNGSYSWKQLTITAGSHQLTAASGMNAFTYALGSFNSYAYHLGFDYDATPVGLNEPAIPGQMNIWPNPMTVSATVAIHVNGVITSGLIEIYSYDGRKVKEKQFSGNTVQIDRDQMASGLYSYRVSMNGNPIGTGSFMVE